MPHITFDQQVTFLYTRNPGASFAFYETVLELPLVLDQGVCRIYRAGSGFLGICRRDDAPDGPHHPGASGVIVTLVAQDVDGWYNLLRERGIVFEHAPALNSRYNIYHCFLRDPNGYLIEIQRFLDPAWPKH